MSKKGTSSFIIQRATAVLLIPLAAWLLFNLIAVLGEDYAGARTWLENPLNSLFVSAFIVIGALHMRIGMTEIILDYIHSWMKDVLLFINWLVALGLIAATLWAVYTISFAG
jgi:succinate dehydrogenase membrane anchor subunit